MDRKAIYSEWLGLKFEGRAFCSNQTIKKCDMVLDINFEYYVEYQNYLFEKETNITSIRQRRSKILDFLSSYIMKDCSLNSVTQEQIESYFFNVLGTDSDSTYMARVNYVKGFFDYLSERLPNKIEWNGLRLSRDELNTSNEFVKKAMTAKQISFCRNRYKNDLRKLYIFEMLYYTDFSKEEIKNLKFDDVDFIDYTINLGKKVNIPKSLIKLIADMHKKGLLEQTYDIDACIEQMKKELKEYGINNFKPKDVAETKKLIYWRCPQCGRSYEAIADNWCVCQYTDTGNYWIVCRENCGNE